MKRDPIKEAGIVVESIETLKSLAKGHYFSETTMKMFQSQPSHKCYRMPDGSWFFIDSTCLKLLDNSKRRFYVKHMTKEGRIVAMNTPEFKFRFAAEKYCKEIMLAHIRAYSDA